MTKYEEIAQTIRERITGGTYQPETLLPNQTDFVDEFGVSRMTIKKALNLLTKEGLINSQRGAGTKVMSPSLWGFITNATNKFELEKLQITEMEQQRLSCEILSFEVTFPKPHIQELLSITKEQPVYHIKRLFSLDDEQPYVLEDLSIPVFLVPGLTQEVISKSIYNYLISELNLHFAGTYRNIYAEQHPETAGYFGCDEDEAMLVTEQVAYLKDGRPVEFSLCRSINKARVITLVNTLNT
ncbi:GntR family transcriptional regulator [Enterococcus sp. PF1-24]|uniref:GntR family transcriptional regulator n=1 Tax=unclassified Enterococcus TaxID=2608891 RepID=UPI002472EC47|nr:MULTISPECIES: GntR family transcriptional regulator [unclassified Enterococcus]MDH6364716.1 GntR family transcriptional regulator [Enterococcus sp. PFB1-1]MDH6401808.1 GntR family transcriptional regulator [Enterococcus sp. PF1-24]